MDLSSIITVVSIAAIPLVLAITLHEVAHGWVAKLHGDRTAESQGRLTLNPLSHVDLVGTLLMPALQLLFFKTVLFGWAKPVPVAQGRLRNPRRDMVRVALAGPVANILMAVCWAAILALVARLGVPDGSPAEWLVEMSMYGVTINALLAAFNLLPLPPLDGGRVLVNALPRGPFTRFVESLEPWGLVIVMVLLVTNVAWMVVGPLKALLETGIYALVGLN